jgi:Tol biopolymer transport system component
MIVFRASRPSTDEELKDFRDNLAENLVRPSKLEIFVMNADGTGMKQVTNNGKANFGPYFFPDGKSIIFCSNMDDPQGRNFDLYKINIDGTGLEKITYNDTFDGFPMFSLSDGGKKFVFCQTALTHSRAKQMYLCAIGSNNIYPKATAAGRREGSHSNSKYQNQISNYFISTPQELNIYSN